MREREKARNLVFFSLISVLSFVSYRFFLNHHFQRQQHLLLQFDVSGVNSYSIFFFPFPAFLLSSYDSSSHSFWVCVSLTLPSPSLLTSLLLLLLPLFIPFSDISTPLFALLKATLCIVWVWVCVWEREREMEDKIGRTQWSVTSKWIWSYSLQKHADIFCFRREKALLLLYRLLI